MSKKLIKFKINTVVDAEDIVSSVLFDNGVCGCEMEDFECNDNIDKNKSKVCFYATIFDNVKEKNENLNKKIDDNNADNSYFPSNDNIWTNDEINIILLNIIKNLHEYEEHNFMGALTIEREDLTDFDYQNNYEKYLQKFYIDDLCIKTFEEKIEDVDKNKIIININPKNTFGTGMHITTKMCIKSILKYKNNINSFLDIGCGSGILSIIAKKLGINNIKLFDIDDSIKNVIVDNFNNNNIKPDEYNLSFGNVLNDEKFKNDIFNNKYDMIVINILSNVVIKYLNQIKIYQYLNENGILIISGIYFDKKNEIIDFLNNIKGLKILEINEEDNFINVNCKYDN